MRIKMAIQPSGTRNGADWPKVGSVIELPDAEASDLVASGLASETDEKVTAESADIRGAHPWESVGVANHDYPDATGRTGPPLTEVPAQLATATPASPLIENPGVDADPDGPQVPDDARETPPVGPIGEVASAETPTKTTSKSSK